MRISKSLFVTILVTICGLAAVGVFIFLDHRSFSSVSKDGVDDSITAVDSVTFEGSGDATIEKLPVNGLDPIPDLGRPSSIPPGFSAEAARIMRESIMALIVDIKKNPRDASLWLDLGIKRQEIQDYEGAKEAWEYVIQLSPNNATAFNNLGNLYHYYLKDYEKSETNFKRAIALSPKYVLLYQNLHDLYRYSYKQRTTAAADILKQGIKENPEAVDLYISLAAYYKAQGNRSDAKTYYEQALSLAIAVGNTDLRMAIGEELAEL